MEPKHQSCFSCNRKYSSRKHIFRCPECGGSLQLVYPRLPQKKAVRSAEFRAARPHHWKYWMFYPVPRQRAVTMEEGGTPLLQSTEHDNIMFKYEGENPTGSFKDRGSTVELTHAKELGSHRLLCASTGNMGASVAAYSSRVHLDSEIWIPHGAAGAKIEQIKAYGAELVEFGQTYSQPVNKTVEIATEKRHIYLAGDYPYRLEGQKSVAFEIADQLSWEVPDNIVVPVGMGTLCFSTFKAFAEMKAVGLTDEMPTIVAVQASGVAPVVEAFREGAHEVRKAKDPETIAGAINCDMPVYGHEVLHALERTDGFALKVTDQQIREAQQMLGEEGMYAEPAAAASYAGAMKARLGGKTVCVVTGSGLKDPFSGMRNARGPEDILEGNVKEVKKEVRKMPNPDYRELLEAEKHGKDRKTLKDWFRKRLEA